MTMKILVAVSDLHINSTVGLCSPSVDLDDGGKYIANDGQKEIWSAWNSFWETVSKTKARHKCPVVTVVNGEVVDDLNHTTTQLVTNNKADIIKMALDATKPMLEHSNKLYITRGTEAHSGPGACLDELYAGQVGAIGPSYHVSSWWGLMLDVGGVKFDIAHHPGTGSRSHHTRHGPAGRIAASTVAEFASDPSLMPDVVLRAHNHMPSDSGITYPVRALITPSWQLSTSFSHRIGHSNRLAPVGGFIFLCNDGRYSMTDLLYNLGKGQYRKA